MSSQSSKSANEKQARTFLTLKAHKNASWPRLPSRSCGGACILSGSSKWICRQGIEVDMGGNKWKERVKQGDKNEKSAPWFICGVSDISAGHFSSLVFPPNPNHKPNPNCNPNPNTNSNPAGRSLTILTPLITLTLTEQGRGEMSEGVIRFPVLCCFCLLHDNAACRLFSTSSSRVWIYAERSRCASSLTCWR